MADVKTSQENPANTLDGTELVRIVQGGYNARTTTAGILGLSVVAQLVNVDLANATIDQPFDMNIPAGHTYVVWGVFIVNKNTTPVTTGQCSIRTQRGGAGVLLANISIALPYQQSVMMLSGDSGGTFSPISMTSLTELCLYNLNGQAATRPAVVDFYVLGFPTEF